MRAIGGIILGLVAAAVGAIALGLVAMISTFSVPPGVDPGNIRQLVGLLAALPTATLVALAIAWSLAALAGAWVARRIGQGGAAGWIVTLLVAGYFGFSGWVLPFPLWAKVLWALGPLIGGYLGNRPGKAPADPAAAI